MVEYMYVCVCVFDAELMLMFTTKGGIENRVKYLNMYCRPCVISIIRINSNVSYAEDWTQGLIYVKQALSYWPVPQTRW